MAHPRLRGEDAILDLSNADLGGSPPPARGGPGFKLGRLSKVRLTPACAGRTLNQVPAGAQHEAHPRLRGEDFVMP